MHDPCSKIPGGVFRSGRPFCVSVASDEVALLYPADADHPAFDWCAAFRFAAGRICMRGRCDPIVTGMTDQRRAIERSDKPAGDRRSVGVG